MLAALTLLVLTTPRLYCWPPLLRPPREPVLRILPRTSPEFSPLAHAPDAFDEPRARPRSFASLDCSPALCNEGPPPRVVTFRRSERKPFAHPRHSLERRLPF